jgi:hypothetical protein
MNALRRYNEVELRCLKLLLILVPGTPRADLDDLRAAGFPIEADAGIERIKSKYTR